MTGWLKTSVTFTQVNILSSLWDVFPLGAEGPRLTFILLSINISCIMSGWMDGERGQKQNATEVHATIRQHRRSSSMLTRNPEPDTSPDRKEKHPVRPLLAGCRATPKHLPL